ncbi:MAG: dUTP diphosphatase [Deltaproteobacteria bacterium]|nr:dUTP diphosphatase [Deltaproteobacteria bacterium]
MRIEVKRLRDDAVLPRQMTEGAAGMDLAACLDAPIEVAAGHRVLVPTGLALAIPRGYEGQVRPRSGWAVKTGITVLNAPGTIDSDYRGEVKVALVNLGQEPVEIRGGDRIAQLCIAKVHEVDFLEVEVLPLSARGEGGFGSSGRGG